MVLQYTGLPSLGASSSSGGIQSVTITSTGGTIAVTNGGTSGNPTFNLETTGAVGKIFTDATSTTLSTLDANTESNFTLTWTTPFTTSISVVAPSVVSSNNIPMTVNVVSRTLTGAVVQVYNSSGIQALNVIASAMASGI